MRNPVKEPGPSLIEVRF